MATFTFAAPGLNQLFPLLYLLCLGLLLWQALRVMGRGFAAVSGAGDRPKVTVHPELLDADGRVTQEELLTVRFSGDNEPVRSDDHAS
jgi:hypothetical protein